jgi:hypothetical protein
MAKPKTTPVRYKPGAEAAKFKTWTFGRDETVVCAASAEDIARLESNRSEQTQRTAAAAAKAMADLEAFSPGRRLLLRLGVGKEASAVPVDLAGETVYIRRLDASGFQQVSVISNRTASGTLDFTNSDNVRSFIATALIACVRLDSSGEVQAFTGLEAWDLASSTAPDARAAVDTLLAKILEVNPDLLTSPEAEGGGAAEIDEREKKGARAGSPSTGSGPASTSALNSSPSSGSKSIPSTPAPS